MYLIIRVLWLISMTLTASIITYDVQRRCKNMRCENDSHCMETIVLDENNPPEAEARCICHGHFTGPRCEAKLVLSPDVIKAHYIGFRVSFHNVSNGNVISSENIRNSLSYSIQYWKNASEKSCSIATNIYSPIHGLDGLQMDTKFTLCVVTDPASWCAPREVNLTHDKNCIVVRTLKNDNSFLSQSFVLPVAIAIIVILGLAVIGLACMFKRCFFKSNNGAKSKRTKADWAKERRKEKQRQQASDLSRVKESSVEDLLIDNFPNADNSIDRLTTRQTGTSTFAPLYNRTSLSNVLEEGSLYDNVPENESSHMLDNNNSSEA